jgi:hypothetical protein
MIEAAASSMACIEVENSWRGDGRFGDILAGRSGIAAEFLRETWRRQPG